MLENNSGVIFGVANECAVAWATAFKCAVAWATASAHAGSGARLTFTFFEIVSFLVSVASLVVSCLAFWLCLHLKNEADRDNREAARTLNEIRADVEALTRFGLEELKLYGEKSRDLIDAGSRGKEKGPSIKRRRR